MVDQVAEFLSKQERFRCERLSADLTMGQCEANRKRVANIQKGINPVISCEGCAGLGKAVEIKERIMPAKSLEEIASVKPWAVKVCTECKETKKIHGYGQCAKCLYKKYGKAMRPPKEDPSPSPLQKKAKLTKGFEVYACPECSKTQERPIGQTACPACGFDTADGTPAVKEKVAESLDVISTVKPSSNPLLPAAVECEVILNFSSNKSLYDWLQEEEVTPDHIIELLDMACNRGLRPAK